ncbi:MAG: hemerythrin domain-containing protein [Elusimicrobia bacterium]|nr:hemerythrin domain-containing protein [Candidatus Liberimonas magnetica]
MNKKELQNILAVFNTLVEFKTTVLHFYEACASCYMEDRSFWDSLVEEERHKIQDIKRMAAIINERPDKFEVGEQFKSDLTQIFSLYAKNNIRKVKNCSLSKRDALITGLNIELSSTSTKYNEIVRTSDFEYLGIAKDVTSNILVHRSKLNKKINALDKLSNAENGPSDLNVSEQDKEASTIKYIDPVINIILAHNQFKEYLGLFRSVIAEENPKQHVWENIEKVVRFNMNEIESHFLFEESFVFKKVSESPVYLEAAPVVDELLKEHNKLRSIIKNVEALLLKSDIPLSKEKGSKLRMILNDFIDIVLSHLSKEEEKILPLLNTLKQ